MRPGSISCPTNDTHHEDLINILPVQEIEIWRLDKCHLPVETLEFSMEQPIDDDNHRIS